MRVSKTSEFGADMLVVEGDDTPTVMIMNLAGDPTDARASLVAEFQLQLSKANIPVSHRSITREIAGTVRNGIRVQGRLLIVDYVFEVYDFVLDGRGVVVALSFSKDEEDLAKRQMSSVLQTLSVPR